MIECRDLTVRFGEKTVLDAFTASFPDAGCTAVAGPSGTGKTTLLRVLAGLLRPDAGTVRGLAERKIGVVFQQDRLLPWKTARENVAIVSDAARAEELLAAMELSDAADLLPGELSGGMCRRVAIARALAFSDDVLLLDEPFTGLDGALRARIAASVRASAQCIVLVTHDPEDAVLLGAEKTVSIG